MSSGLPVFAAQHFLLNFRGEKTKNGQNRPVHFSSEIIRVSKINRFDERDTSLNVFDRKDPSFFTTKEGPPYGADVPRGSINYLFRGKKKKNGNRMNCPRSPKRT